MKSWQRIASWALSIGLIVVALVFSIPVRYGDAYWPLAFADWVALGLVVWFAGGRRIFGADDRRRRLATAGLLFVTPFVLFALLPGFGPPDSLGSLVLEQVHGCRLLRTRSRHLLGASHCIGCRRALAAVEGRFVFR